MRNWFVFALLTFMLLSCKEEVAETPVCKYQHNDPQLQVYNDLLIELVENRFFNLYLGDKADVLQDEFFNNLEPDDSAAILAYEEKLLQIKQKAAKDTADFKTVFLYYKNDHKALFDEFEAALWKSSEPNDGIRQLLAKYNADSAAVFRNFSEAQQKYKAADFQACTFKVGALGEAENVYELEAKQKVNAIGQVSFSEIHWNKQQDKGVLYYEFYCGGKCGKGELIGFEKVNGRWKISDSVQLWVS